MTHSDVNYSILKTENITQLFLQVLLLDPIQAQGVNNLRMQDLAQLLLSAELQKLQESNEKWTKLEKNLVLQSGAVIEELKIASGGGNQVTIAGMQAHDDRLNQFHDTPLHLKLNSVK